MRVAPREDSLGDRCHWPWSYNGQFGSLSIAHSAGEPGRRRKRSSVGGGPREPRGGTCTFAPLGLKKGRRQGANSLARATEQFNADGTAAEDLERKVITISELATSVAQWLLTLGKGRCVGSAEEKAPGALRAPERWALKGRSLRAPVRLSPLRCTRCGSPTVRACLRLHSVPRRGAPSQAREASRAVWSARGLGKSLPTPAGSSWQLWD